MSKKGKIGKIYFSSKIRVGGNTSKIGKKGNVAKFSSEIFLRHPVMWARKVILVRQSCERSAKILLVLIKRISPYYSSSPMFPFKYTIIIPQASDFIFTQKFIEKRSLTLKQSLHLVCAQMPPSFSKGLR